MHVPDQPPHRNLRHLSAREVALLNAFPKEAGWNDPARFLLAGMGQNCKPHAVGMDLRTCSHHLIDAKMAQGPQNNPKTILACTAMEVSKLRDLWFQGESTVTMELFREQLEGWLFLDQKCPHPISGMIETKIDDLSASQEATLVEQVEAAEDAERNAQVSHDGRL